MFFPAYFGPEEVTALLDADRNDEVSPPQFFLLEGPEIFFHELLELGVASVAAAMAAAQCGSWGGRSGR